MAIWQDLNGVLHDDMNGEALALPDWPVGMTKLTAIPAPTLAQAQAAQNAVLQSAYLSAIAQPVSYTTKGGVTKLFQADPQSQQNLSYVMQGYSAAGVTPTGFYWVSQDNTQVPFTYADLQGLAAAMVAQGWTAFQRLQTDKTAVNAATTVTQVQAVVW